MNDLEKKEYQKRYRENNKERKREQAKIYYQKNKDKIKNQIKNYYSQKTDKRREYIKNYYLLNKDNYKEKSKEYYIKNKDYQKNYNIKNKDKIYARHKNKMETNPLYKLTNYTRSLIKLCLRRQGFTKKSKTYRILGCEFKYFKIHIERQFTKGMTWENQGEWHLDHIYPVSLAKDEEEIIRLNHYTNFQPLWAIDNIKKSNKIIANTQIKLI
tara:strand:- start:2456 stop:3094 length:639 start_codon:yes stop_codon:yes gene_type:complete